MTEPPPDVPRRRPHAEGQPHGIDKSLEGAKEVAPGRSDVRSSIDGTAMNTILALMSTFLPAFTLIFGGCCSNVYTLEALISSSTSSGTLITFVQFLAVSIFTFPTQLTYSKSKTSTFLPQLEPQLLPLRKLLVYTTFFLTINILNNLAFGYRISVPLHIILRSAGPVTTMIIGYFFGGRRYSFKKVLGVLILFIGVVTAAIADSYSKAQLPPSPMSPSEPDIEPNPALSTPSNSPAPPPQSQFIGLILILLALLLASFQGLFTDSIYQTHGRSASLTTQLLFYSHFLSLPYFLLPPNIQVIRESLSQLSSQTTRLSTFLITDATATSLYQLLFACFHRDPLNPSPTTFFSSNSDIVHPAYDILSLLSSSFSTVPTYWVTLVLNSATQYLCISGVNRLSSLSSSLTVGIVLNVRKLVSLILSIWFFGNDLSPGIMVGAALVFLGGGLYAWPSSMGSYETGKSKQGSTKEVKEKKLQERIGFGLGTDKVNGLGPGLSRELSRESRSSEKDYIWDLDTKTSLILPSNQTRSTGSDLPHLFTDLDETRGQRRLPGELVEGQFKRAKKGSE